MEMKREEKPQILFLETNDDLVGIDLNEYGTCELNTSPLACKTCTSCGCDCQLQCQVPPPPLAPIRCRLRLSKNGYPRGMRHVKSDHDGKHYLFGGAFFDPDTTRFIGYSDSVYELHVDSVSVTNMHDGDGDDDDKQLIGDVLRPVTNLNCPKFALKANLRGTTYALHYWINIFHGGVPYSKPIYPKFTFEHFDPVNKSWHQAPTPLFFYESESESESESEKEAISEEEEEEEEKKRVKEPIRWRNHLVVDDKLLLFCGRFVHVFCHLTQKWEASNEFYTSIERSFKRCEKKVPSDPTLWISDFGFNDDGGNSLGVLLSIEIVPGVDCYGIKRKEIPAKYYRDDDWSQARSFSETYKVHAYAMSTTTCQLEWYQQFDEVFLGMIPTPLVNSIYGGMTITQHLLDLGKGTQKNQRRICAILAGCGLTTHIPYLFISIFDVQIIQEPRASIDPTKSCEFLKVSIVKKLVFKLDMDHDRKRLIPLDAFIL